MTSKSLINTIAQHNLFADLTQENIQSILDASTVQQLEPGDVLITPGEQNNTLYVLYAGELKVILDDKGTKVSFPIQPGECLGEMSLIEGNPTSALVVAEKPSSILLMPEDTFWHKFVSTPQGVRNLMSMMSLRIHRNNEALIKEVEEQIKYAHLQKELDTAGNIQANMLPDAEDLFPNHPQVDVFATMHPAREVGGDFYDALALDDEHLYIAIGDVSGKGMPAALFMMRSITSMRMSVINNPGFEGVLPSVNSMLVKNNDDMMFVTIFAGVLNVRTGVLRYVNGGHNRPFVALDGGGFELLEVPKGTLLGVMETGRYELAELHLKPGDSLILYTDGVTEATRADNELFEEPRAQETLNGVNGESMKQLVRTLERAVEDFVDGAPQFDDITVLALKYLGE